MKFCPKCKKETERNFRGDCVPCKLAYAAIYRAKNPEKVKAAYTASRLLNPEGKKAYDAAYSVANKERLKEYRVVYYAKNSEKSKAATADYKKKNPEKVKAATEAWRVANPEKFKASRAAWKAANPEKVKAGRIAYEKKNIAKRKAYSTTRYLENTTKIKAANSQWNAENKEAMRIICHNRRARKRENGGVLSRGLSEKLFKLQRGKCACCGLPLGVKFHLDHITPIALGGPNTDDNIQLLRQRCNNQKHAKHPVDFMQERGFLL